MTKDITAEIMRLASAEEERKDPQQHQHQGHESGIGPRITADNARAPICLYPFDEPREAVMRSPPPASVSETG